MSRRGYTSLDGSPIGNLPMSTLAGLLSALIAVVAIVLGSVAIHRLNYGFTTVNITAQNIMTNVVMNGVLAHITSGEIPPTHAMQTLANDPEAPPLPSVKVLENVTLGIVPTNQIVSGGNLVFKATRGGPWQVRDLAADPYTAAADVAGTRVMQGGNPEVYGGASTCTPDMQSPGEGVTTTMEISSANFQSGQLTLYLRSGSEDGFDFVEVRQNGALIYRVTGAGPSASDAYVEGTLVIDLKVTDVIEVAHIKDGSCWGGYDLVYFWATLSTSPRLSMTIPLDLAPYVGKDIQVCAVDNGGHTIYLEGGGRHFDPNGAWKVLQFQGNGVDGCCATLKIMTADRVSVISRDACTLFCGEPDLFHCVDPLRPAATSPFHGIWRSATKNYERLSYAVIDASTNPIGIKFHRGTVNNPQESAANFNLFPILAGTFSSLNDTNIHDPALRTEPELATFQPGGQSFLFYYGRDTNSLADEVAFAGLYEKTTVIPPLIPISSGSRTEVGPDDPAALFRNFFDTLVFELYGSLAVEDVEEKWIGYPAAKALMETIISTGTGTLTTTIIQTRVTHSSNAAEGITEFRTSLHSGAVAPSRVTISGFTGACTALNGNFLMAIAATSTKNGDGDLTYMDWAPYPTAGTVHHKVGVFLDSSAIPVFPGTTIANCTGTPLLSVSYGPITPTTNYIRTIGAIQYWLYESAKVFLHTRPSFFFDESTTVPRSGVAHVREEWSDIRADLAAGADAVTALSHFKKTVGVRDNTAASAFYPGGAGLVGWQRFFQDTTADRRSWQGRVDLTGQYGIRPDREASIVIFQTDSIERATHWYNIPVKNYLDGNTAYPTWKMIGTSRTHPDNLLAQVVYPGGEGDEFDTIMTPMGTLPATDYSVLWASSNPNGGFIYTYDFEYNFVNAVNQEAVFVGRINPAYTGGFNIGYMRFIDTQFYDVSGLSESAEFCPSAHCDPSSRRHNKEALASIYAKMMQYLLIDLDCDHIIIDNRANGGGSGTIQTLIRGFFGGEDEKILSFGELLSRKDNGNAPKLDISGAVFANEVMRRSIDAHYALPSLSEANYPGSVLTNGEVVFLTDTTAGSGGDIFPNNFLGPLYDGQLGNNTQVSILGSIDGRITGSSCSFSSVVSRDSPLLKDAAGVIIPAFSTGIDCGPGFYRLDGTTMANRHLGLEIDPATGLTGVAGGNALPQDWDELVYKDLGYVANTRTVLPGWTKPQTPTNVIEVNPLSMTSGSNIVTVTMSAPHGFTTGDDVALGNTAIPVPTTAGISSVALTGGHIITVTGPTTFTFAATSVATYPGYAPVPATSTASGVGGSIRITNRSQWRDAWLEASIATVVAQAKKRRYAPDHKKRKEERKAKLRAQRKAQEEQKKRRREQKPKIDLRAVSRRFKRDVSCPSNVVLVPASAAPATKNVTFNIYLESELERAAEVKRVKAEVKGPIIDELLSGGMCISDTGVLMVTPTCSSFTKIVAADRTLKAEESKKKRTTAEAGYNACIKKCGSNRMTRTYRSCIIGCGSQHEKE